MNRLLVFSLIFTLCYACQSDDDAGSDIQVNIEEEIQGEWRFNRREIGGVLENLEICETFTTIHFFEDGSFHVELFIGDEIDDCQSAAIDGSWEYIGNDRITIQLELQSEAGVYLVLFSDNFTTLVLKEDVEGGSFEEYKR